MTGFWSPDRPRLANGRPRWQEQNRALPGIYLTPAEPGPDTALGVNWVLVELVIDGAWVETTITEQQVLQLVMDWRDDTEKALGQWFNTDPPTGALPDRTTETETETAEGTVSLANAEDLGL